MRGQRWTAERANAWYAEQPSLAGCNFLPSTAVNQLEMWQAETFDAGTIKRERVGCYNWGLVNGRSQTHVSWTGKSDVWFHDVLRPDGTPHNAEEAPSSGRRRA